MVEKLKKILADLEAQRGIVSLFAIFKMDDVIDKWTLLLSAPWINDANGKEIFESLRNSFLSNLTEEERSSIARVAVLNNGSHLTQELFHYKSGTKITDKTQINGNTIYEGEIIKSTEGFL